MRALIVRLLFTVLSVAAAPAFAAGLRLNLWPVPPIYTGTTYQIGVDVQKEDRNDGIVHQGPFTFRTVLPAGVRYVGFNGGLWSCVAQPDQRDVSCTYSGTLDFWNPNSMSLGINAMVDYGIAPGSVTVSGTVSSAQVPLPPTPTCVAPPSTTGCASVATAFVTSKLQFTGWGVSGGQVTSGPVATWIGQPLEAGQPNMFVFEFLNTGFGQVNTPVTLDVWLPPGVSYDGALSGIPVWTCSNQASPGHVRCTTPYLYDSLSGFLSMRIQVAPTIAVPGPLFVHAAVGNNLQAPPGDCVANPTQLGCGRLQFHTRVPRVATLVASSMTHSPPVATLGTEFGPLVLEYRNIGEANAGATNLYLQLPPHIEYRGVLSSLPAATCTTQGTLAAGQIVVCQTSGLGAPPFNQGSLSLRLYGSALAASPGPLPVVAAVDLGAAPNTATLASCVANPAQSFCATDALTTYFPCALQWADGIFCDGIEPFVRP
ncbi:MAG TPA: hypothetical protein VLF18_19265 [Tahibacter sp.]|uniref:hypothetical protein n=1 Tax=Tahibacter sp. TaxID=2056211 RepID=UPI002C6A03B7|nr:hypothetical protein [Tahibacter sp.]HSX62329.1 hypothetical protein [Tahibacter sp.]